MATLFQRDYRLTLGAIAEVTALRISFEIERTTSSISNTGEIRIWNLSPDTRGRLTEHPGTVLLEAGYLGEIGTIFLGDVAEVSHERPGADWVTTLSAGDGEKSRKTSRVALSVAPGTGYDKVLAILAKKAEVGIGNMIKRAVKGGIRDGGLTGFINGAALSGPTHDEIDRIIKALGLEVSIQDDQFQVLGPGELAGSPTGFLLTPRTGLIGSPQLGKAKRDKKKQPAGTPPGERSILRARSLLNPALRPGVGVVVDSIQVDGIFRIERVTHTGDTHEGGWYSDLEAVPV